MSLQKKLIVVGDGACGKTCLLISFVRGKFMEEYVPTVFENYVADVTVDGFAVELSLWDTSGQEDYDRLRPIQYPETDVVLICFSVVWKDSLENVVSRWWPEVRHFCPTAPILLIGTKSDLRQDKDEIRRLDKMKKRPTRLEEIDVVFKKVGAVKYVECSSKSGSNVQEVFLEATKAALGKRKKRRKRDMCVLI